MDCEEVHVGENCPICASDRYAFLTTWLPAEERRRWRRPAPQQPAVPAGNPVLALVRRIGAMFGAAPAPSTPTYTGPRTRRADFIPPLDFEEPIKTPEPEPVRQERRATGTTR